MNFSKKSLLVFSLAFLLIAPILVTSAQSNDSSSQSQNQPTVLAKVNGTEVTQQQLTQNAQVYSITRTLSQQYPTFTELLMTSQAGQDFLNEYIKKVLDNLIDQHLQIQEIKKRGITVSDEEVQAQIASIIENYDQFEDEEALGNYLQENQNMTLANYKSQLKDSLKNQKLRDEVTSDVSVTDQEISSYYEENKQSYTDKEGNVKSLKEVKGQVETTLEEQKKNEEFTNWLNQARADAEIQKFLDRL